MKRSISGLVATGVLLLGCLAGPATGQESHEPADDPTAYAALRLVGKTLGADAINRVVEVTGRGGKPQPTVWKIVLKEESGSKEIEVVNGRIAAQRPLARAVVGVPVKLQDLNLDSSGAFDATDAQARKARVRFDSVDYTLRTSEKTGKPLWTLALFNQTGASAGTMKIAAHSGAIVWMDGRIAADAAPGASQPVAGGPGTVKPLPAPVHVTPTPAPAVIAVNPPPPRREIVSAPVTTTVTSVQTVPAPAPVVVDIPDAGGPPPAPPEEGGGFFTRTGRTLDHTSRSVNHSLGRASDDVGHSLRHAGATIQRFFTGHSDLDKDGNPPPPPATGQAD